MRAGAGKSEIELVDEYLEVENFAVIHRTLNVRAVAVEDDQGERMLLLSLEITSIPGEEAEEIRKLAAKQCGVRRDCVWVCVTHTFSAPHLLPDSMLDKENIAHKRRFRENLRKACLEAACQATDGLRPAVQKFGSGWCRININRDVELKDGWWIGTGGPGLTDHRVSVVKLEEAQSGKTIAVLFHYGMQSSVMDGSELSAGGKAVTPDVAGIASTWIEGKLQRSVSAESHVGDSAAPDKAEGKNKSENVGAFPAPVAIFLLGGAGDQAPVERAVSETFVDGQRVRKDRQEVGFPICERQGSELGECVCEILDQMENCSQEAVQETDAEKPRKISVETSPETPDLVPEKTQKKRVEWGSIHFQVPGKEMERDLKKLHPVKSMEYVPTQEQETLVEILGFGGLVLVGVKPELNCVTVSAIQTCSPFEHTLVCTMVNGASKYMADRGSYDRYTYEAMNSPFGKGAAEILVKQTLGLLETMKGTAG